MVDRSIAVAAAALLVVVSVGGGLLADPELSPEAPPSDTPALSANGTPEAVLDRAFTRLNRLDYRVEYRVAANASVPRDRMEVVYRREVDNTDREIAATYAVGETRYRSYANDLAVWVTDRRHGGWKAPQRGGAPYRSGASVNPFRLEAAEDANVRVENETGSTLVLRADARLVDNPGRPDDATRNEGYTVLYVEKETGTVRRAESHFEPGREGIAYAEVSVYDVGRADVERPGSIGFSLREFVADVTSYRPK